MPDLLDLFEQSLWVGCGDIFGMVPALARGTWPKEIHRHRRKCGRAVFVHTVVQGFRNDERDLHWLDLASEVLAGVAADA